MQPFTIPTCYFPTTALFLDDSRDFLLNFVLQLDEGVAYRTFNDPFQALNYLQHKNGQLHCLNETIKDRETSLLYKAIQGEVYNPNRFAEISVVVIDYAMPGMNGLDFCRQIENQNIKKILLTGQADEKMAIDAFNEGLIHRYVKKSDPNAAELITNAIYELQMQYFQAMSNILTRMLTLPSPSCMQDKAFADFFQTFCQTHHIVEYYLADDCGSFLMLDDDANTSFLIIKTEAELEKLYEQGLQQGIDKSKLHGLTMGEEIPPTLSDDNRLLGEHHWSHSLMPADRIDGKKAYYYAHLKGNDLFGLRQPKILSYHRYLEELDAQELLMND